MTPTLIALVLAILSLPCVVLTFLVRSGQRSIAENAQYRHTSIACGYTDDGRIRNAENTYEAAPLACHLFDHDWVGANGTVWCRRCAYYR